MLKMTVQFDGLNKIRAGLYKAPLATVNEAGKAVEKSLNEIRNNAIREAPVNKQTGGGNLRQMIRPVHMISKLVGEILSAAGYSAFVHEGTSAHIIQVVNKKVLANVRTGQFFGEIVHHPGTQANPFFTRAIKRSRDKVNKYWKDAMVNIMKTIKN
jgi:hypothetical protein